ncbi:MAG: peptidylprolyl isomerase [Planctomycetota bacterium]
MNRRLHSHTRHPAGAPAFEALETRWLLAADPTFATDLADYYIIDEDSPLTLAVDGADADAGDALTITAMVNGEHLTAQPYDHTSGNRFAVLNFEDSDGNVIGEILVQLFEGRSPLATERFMTLATSAFDSNGEAITPDADNPAFYTDVVVHRVIPEFMVQTGDAANGDGTGGSPLGTFEDEFDPSLSFASAGLLAMANSGEDTNDSQFFLTDVPTPHLDGEHTIFGTIINGWDVYQQLINVPTNAQDMPLDPPVLASVDILDHSDQDGSITLVADEDFDAPTEVTITLEDGNGGQVAKTITLVPSTEIDKEEDLPEVPTIDEVAFSPGDAHEETFEVTYTATDPKPLDVRARAGYDGEGEVTVSVTPVAGDDNAYTLTADLPDQYDGTPFKVAISATLAGYGNLIPSVQRFDVSLGDRPTVVDPGPVNMLPGETTTVPLEIADSDETDFIVTADTDQDGVTVTIDPDTYELTVTAPADLMGAFDVTVTALEQGYASWTNLTPGEQTITVHTLGERPAVANVPQRLNLIGGEIHTFDAGITDDSGVDLAVDLTCRLNSGSAEYAWVEAIEDEQTGEVLRYEITIDLQDLPKNFSGTFEVTVTAVEADYADVVDETTSVFHVVTGMAYDPDVVDFVVPDEKVTTTTVVGDLLYVGTEAGLEIYDMAAEDGPALLGSYGTETKVADIVVVNTPIPDTDDVDVTAYIGTYAAAFGTYIYGNGKLISLDVGDPANIEKLQELTTNQAHVRDLDVQGDRLYIANGTSGVAVYNITDPGDMVRLGKFSEDDDGFSLTNAAAVTVSGSHLYVGDEEAGLVVLEVSNPSLIEKADEISTDVRIPKTNPSLADLYLGRDYVHYEGTPAAMAVDGETLYLADSGTGLHVYDLSDPASPDKTGWIGWPSTYLAVAGDLVVAGQGGFHRIIDVSDPESMTLVHSQFAPDYVGTATVTPDGLIASPNGAEGVTLLDGADLMDVWAVSDRRRITDANGTPVTFIVRGGGHLRIHRDDATGAIRGVDVAASTDLTRVIITTPRGQTAEIGDLHVFNDIHSIIAPTATVTGDVTIEGSIVRLTLGDVNGDGEQLMRIDGPEVLGPRDRAWLTLGRVNDLSLDTAMPVARLQVVDWIDDETDAPDVVTAPSVGRLIATGSRQAAGYFQADVVLNEDGTAVDTRLLGAARIAGGVTESDWTLYGTHGPIRVGVPNPAWTPTVDQSLRETTVYGRRTFELGEGRTLTVALTGGGTVRVTPDDGGADDLASLAVDHPTDRTRVVLAGTGDVRVDDLVVNGSLGSVAVTDGVVVSGDITINGHVNHLAMADVGGDGAAAREQTLQIVGDGERQSARPVSVNLGDVTDLSIDSAVPIHRLAVDRWTDDETGQADSVYVPSIDVLASGGAFQADLTLNDLGDATGATVLGRAFVNGPVQEATWTLYGQAGPIVQANDAWAPTIDTGFRATTVYDRRSFTLADGTVVTVSIAGGGTARVAPDTDGDLDVDFIDIEGSAARTRVIIDSDGRAVTVGEITAADSIGRLYAPDVTLAGDLIAAGRLNRLDLGDVAAAERYEHLIAIDGYPISPRDAATINLGNVTDLRIDSAMPIRSLTAADWQDAETDWRGGDWQEGLYEEADTILAPALDRLIITDGDFQASLDLNENRDAPSARVLGNVQVAGQIDQADWIIGYGDAGWIRAAATSSTWNLDVDGSVNRVDVVGDLDGTLSADAYNVITTDAVLAAAVTAVDADGRDASLGVLRADAATGALDLAGGARSVAVGQWTSGAIDAGWLGVVRIQPGRGSEATGDFVIDVTLASTVGSGSDTTTVPGPVNALTVAGNAGGTWEVESIGSLAVGGDVDALELTASRSTGEANGYALGRVNVDGTVRDSRLLAAGHVGNVTVGAMTGSTLFAGYVDATDAVTGLPTTTDIGDDNIFNPAGRLNTFFVRGLRDEAGSPVVSFVDSYLGAARAGAIHLTYADLDPAGDDYGATVGSLRAFTYHDDTDALRWSAARPADGPQPGAIDNLLIRVV